MERRATRVPDGRRAVSKDICPVNNARLYVETPPRLKGKEKRGGKKRRKKKKKKREKKKKKKKKKKNDYSGQDNSNGRYYFALLFYDLTSPRDRYDISRILSFEIDPQTRIIIRVERKLIFSIILRIEAIAYLGRSCAGFGNRS